MSEEDGKLVAMTAENGMVAMLNSSEIDCQISTAKKYPRNITTFRKEAMSLVTLNERIAESCIYALPRGEKVIEGASARFAEIIASTWGNCRAGARVISEQGEFVTAQGVFLDLERNVAITYEVQRRITDRNGKRFNADMVGVTANAACSIALRNAVFKGVPKAFWDDIYESAKAVVRGDFATLANRRAQIFERCQGFGVTKGQVYALLGVQGEADISLDNIVHLRGLLNAIKEGDTTVEMAFSPQEDRQTAIKTPQRKEKPVETKPVESETKAEAVDTSTGEITQQKAEADFAIAAPKQEGGSGIIASESQMRIIKAKMEAATLSKQNFKNQFGKEVEDMYASEVNAALEWIRNPAGV